MISIVCPFYNEDAIIEASVRLMLSILSALTDEWELIIVNDGSRDRSLELTQRLEAEYPRLRVLSYTQHCGCGYAIHTGVAQARGNYIPDLHAAGGVRFSRLWDWCSGPAESRFQRDLWRLRGELRTSTLASQKDDTTCRMM
jgi:glycosyltransferase involved in cell wall biosynthesis